MTPYSVYGHFKGIFNAFTQTLNAIAGSCDANQSFSERCYINKDKNGFWNAVYRTVNFIAWRETDHCRKALTNEIKRATQKLEQYTYVVLPSTEFDALLNRAKIVKTLAKTVYAEETKGQPIPEFDFDKWWDGLSEQEISELRYHAANFPADAGLSKTEWRYYNKKAIEKAVAYWSERYPVRTPTGMGMGKDGKQA